MRTGNAVGLLLATGVVVSCTGSHKPGDAESLPSVASCLSPPEQDVHFLRIYRNAQPLSDGGCPAPCPGNSPVVNTFPINGFDVGGGGVCNPEGVQVLPGTAHGPGCPGNGNLVFESDRLVVVSNGVRCEHQDMLQGLSFTVRSWNGHQTVLTITRVSQIADATHPPSYQREAYRIVAAGSDTALCDLNQSNAVRSVLGIAPGSSGMTAVATGYAPTANESDDVVALPDPLFSATVREISNDHRFFNLACVDDALAKRALQGVIQESDPEDLQLAALRMMTATYCDRPRTSRGMQFHWTARTLADAPLLKEAWWTSTRAMCIEHTRLEQLGDFSSVTLGSDLVPAGCAPDANGVSPCKTWGDWTAQVIAECEADGFAPAPAALCDDNETNDDFRSYVPTNGTAPLFTRGTGTGYDPGRNVER